MLCHHFTKGEDCHSFPFASLEEVAIPKRGSTLKETNLLLEEQILCFQSGSQFRYDLFGKTYLLFFPVRVDTHSKRDLH